MSLDIRIHTLSLLFVETLVNLPQTVRLMVSRVLVMEVAMMCVAALVRGSCCILGGALHEAGYDKRGCADVMA